MGKGARRNSLNPSNSLKAIELIYVGDTQPECVRCVARECICVYASRTISKFMALTRLVCHRLDIVAGWASKVRGLFTERLNLGVIRFFGCWNEWDYSGLRGVVRFVIDGRWDSLQNPYLCFYLKLGLIIYSYT